MLTALLAWLSGAPTPMPSELRAFVAKPDPSYRWSTANVLGHAALKLTSQTWQGRPWVHDVVVVEPRGEGPPSKGMILEVTGWTPNQKDLDYARILADSSGLRVALLFQIPNQPLWGREEDDLIAYTFERFVETGDPDWPLLFPMVKSVKAAMDALQEWTRQSGAPVDKFVVTGGSKRGWTTWLVGSLGDARVAGLAPAVFDNLDFGAQLRRQHEYWGAYSPLIADYTDRGLQELLSDERGKALVRLVDPIVAQPSVPTLVVTATNDAYWTVDAAQVYWDRLAMPKWALAIPNAPHTMGDRAWWAPSLGVFAAACVGGRPLPKVTSDLAVEGGEWRLSVHATPGPATYRVWRATANDLHFDQKVWSVAEERDLPRSEGARGIWVTGDVAKTLNTAVLVEMVFKTELGEARLTTPVYLVKKSRAES